MTVAHDVFLASIAGLAGSGAAYAYNRVTGSKFSKKLSNALLGISSVGCIGASLADNTQKERELLQSGARVQIACVMGQAYGTGYQRESDLPAQKICLPVNKKLPGYETVTCAARPFATLPTGQTLYNCRS